MLLMRLQSSASSANWRASTLNAVEISPNVSRMTTMEPRELIRNWVSAFNRADSEAVAGLYAKDAVNHQVIWEPLVGRDAIRAMFEREFRRATMVCQIENIFQDGDWAILEWSDPKGLRGCGFFKVIDDQIVFQRGYFDELSFLRQQGLPLPAK
jgi:limonene-1,2-epoxide hydrolase